MKTIFPVLKNKLRMMIYLLLLYLVT